MLDVKYAVRQLLKSPGFTCVALLTIGLCIGANLTIFAVMDAILVRPLPFPESDRLVVVHNAHPATGIERGQATIGDYFDRRKAIEAFESVSMFRQYSYIIGDADSTQRVEAGEVTPEFFKTLGVPLAMGQAFTDVDLDYASQRRAILTDRFWRRHFNADPDVLGRTLMRDGLSCTVVGVLPPDFRYLSSKAEVYFPIQHFAKHRRSPDRHEERARWHDGQMVARLAANRSIVDAQSQLAVLNKQLLAVDPLGQSIMDSGYYSWVAPLHQDHVSTVRPVLVLLQSAVLILLLIGIINLAGLLMIRASGRGKELAVRKALGASRWQLTRKVLVETILLSISGAVVGVLLGAYGLRLIELLAAEMLPLGADIAFGGRSVVVALLLSVAVGVCIALPIIWFDQRDTTNGQLQSETRGGTTSRRVHHTRHSFIVAQIAIAFVLLCGAGLLSVSLKQTLEQAPGFDAEYVLTGELTLPWQDYKSDSSRVAFVRRLLDRLETEPAVLDAAVSSGLPFTNEGSAPTAILTDGSAPGSSNLRSHYVSTVTSDYLKVMDIPLLQGRFLQDSDSGAVGAVWNDTDLTGPPRVAVIDEALAKQYWPNGDAIGRRFSTNKSAFDTRSTFTVVGIVGNVKQVDLTEADRLGAAYLPYVKVPEFHVVIRTRSSPSALASTLERVVRELDPKLPISDVKTMQSRIDDSLFLRRSPAILAAVFATIAILLAAIGTYGVLAYTVVQRRREIGVRIAIGALPEQVARQFLTLGLRLFAVGMLLGCFGAWVAGHAMQNILFEVSSFHLPTFAGALVVIGVVTLIACLLPAVRAARIDPMEALRSE